ncbi:MAG: hypothetical protein H6Q42_4175, partial [Deltaproteobacteria bacterium]|nr:hypothetical protein [Deltaproteobacteria bacterium]
MFGGLAGVGSQGQILHHGEAGKEASSFGDKGDAEIHDLVGGGLIDTPVL